MEKEHGLARDFRYLTLALAALGTLAAGSELLLLRHYGKPAQVAAVALAVLAVIAIGAAAARPTRSVLLGLRLAMLLLLLGSLAGVFFHVQSNLEVVRAIQPDLPILTALWSALSGHAPLLAPGVFGQIALLGLAFTYRHPALAAERASLRATQQEAGLPSH